MLLLTGGIGAIIVSDVIPPLRPGLEHGVHLKVDEPLQVADVRVRRYRRRLARGGMRGRNPLKHFRAQVSFAKYRIVQRRRPIQGPQITQMYDIRRIFWNGDGVAALFPVLVNNNNLECRGRIQSRARLPKSFQITNTVQQFRVVE